MNMKDRINQAYKGSGPKAPETETGNQGPSVQAREPARGQAPAKGQPATKGQAPAAPGLRQAEDKAERLLKTGGDRGLTKAAKFLLLLGTDEAAKVLSHLSPAEVEKISREILSIKSIDQVEAADILAEFGWLVKTRGFTVEGGPDTAKSMLQAAFGPDRAGELLRRAAPETQKPFRFLEDYEAKELTLILKEETPQVIAIILPYLNPKQASLFLERMPEEARIEVVKRIARLDKVSPEILRRVEEGLKERIRRIGTISAEELDGRAALAGILRHVDPRLEESVLDALEDENPELSRSVRERLFTMDDVLRVGDRELQKVLRNFQDRDLALILKGRADDFKEKLLSGVSKNRRILIEDEYAVLGAVRREDADAAAREFLAYLKAAWESGDLVLLGEDELVE